MSTPKASPSGPPLRAIAMVLISLAIVFIGIGAASLGGSDKKDAAAEQTEQTEPQPAATTAPPAVVTTPAATTPVVAEVPTSTSAAPSTSSTSGSATTTTSAASGDVSNVAVRVLNNSTVSGLAAGTASELTANGWTVAETGNYSEGNVATTTVFYGSSATEKAAAEKIAAQLGVTAAPRFAGIASASPGVIVIVTSN